VIWRQKPRLSKSNKKVKKEQISPNFRSIFAGALIHGGPCGAFVGSFWTTFSSLRSRHKLRSGHIQYSLCFARFSDFYLFIVRRSGSRMPRNLDVSYFIVGESVHISGLLQVGPRSLLILQRR
jgi:hypothetical protein